MKKVFLRKKHSAEVKNILASFSQKNQIALLFVARKPIATNGNAPIRGWIDQRCTAPGLRFEICVLVSKKSIGEGDPSRSTEGPFSFSQSNIIYGNYLHYILWCTCTNDIFLIGYDTKVISKQRTRKASTSDNLSFLLDNGNPGHHALYSSTAHRTSRRDETISKRSFRKPICRCLSVTSGRTTAYICLK